MILERESLHGIDVLCPTELGNLRFDREQAKVFAIEIQIATVKAPIFRAHYGCLLLAKVISDTSRLMCSGAGGMAQGIRLEEGPEQVVRDAAGG